MSADPSDTSGLREQIAENQQAIDRLNRDLARKSNEVRIIQQISSEITSTLDLDEVLGSSSGPWITCRASRIP